ncbi:hypothetical protein [uncultured Endozoicomonas sp.]|uniref:hypothetical protein n=1 Tax=uncultured Endozoicomonas sp. TaxID=432652 RepID=UPI002624963D|nr:hypothetical protein [uncultured Endozoicomonas sp.]
MENTQWAWAWWSSLVLINIINLAIALVFFRRNKNDPESNSYLKRMKLMGVIFIAVALYRSIFVSSYLEQLAWFDTLANSSVLIRSMALFAELSFAGLFMGAMLKLNDDLRLYRSTEKSFVDTLVSQSPKFLFLCIFIAQFFATTALITKFELLFAIEETLWGMAFISVVPLAIKQLRAVSVSNHSSSELRLIKPFVWINITWLVGYCSYSVFYHLPIEYWPHVLENLKQGNYQILTGIQAVKNALLVVNETRDLSQWGGVGFVIWHTGYFSICAWIVLLLMNGPRLLPARVKEAASVEIQAA